MQTTAAPGPGKVDLDAELAYWHGVHAGGRLGQHDFDHYRQLLRMGYAVYLAYPRASEEQLYKVLQDSYHRHTPALAIPWDEARWLVRRAWRHLDQSPRPH
ncbi:hypothetical protein [Stenotrophomonas sp. YIM B06876]|uniref:hypothetical protein n=1 Tax=Stenotrophomonas sp. YIM B06876 TaxID=3060211 RepID=UPI0027392822|nr:hypothetical protein [Stenotrophomonas sp. YIM B06876]